MLGMLRGVLQPIVKFKRDYYYTNEPLQMQNSRLPSRTGVSKGAILVPSSLKTEGDCHLHPLWFSREMKTSRVTVKTEIFIKTLPEVVPI